MGSDYLTFQPLSRDKVVELVCSGKQNIDMPNELLGDHHTLHVSSIAHMEKHIRYTGCGRLLEC